MQVEVLPVEVCVCCLGAEIPILLKKEEVWDAIPSN